jgi:hypothetical protein
MQLMFLSIRGEIQWNNVHNILHDDGHVVPKIAANKYVNVTWQ